MITSLKTILKSDFFLLHPPTEQDKGLKDSSQVAEEEICNRREILQAACK
jgi:hypothetical protein